MTPLELLADYEFQHLAQHLVDAGRHGDLHRLLSLETADGANAWFQARDARSETSGYLDDLERARTLADNAARARGAQMPALLGLQCGYALMSGAFNDLATNVNPALSAKLVESGHWTQEQALTYATRGPPENRLDVTVAALARAPESERDDLARAALAAARPVAEDVERIGHVMMTLIDNLPDRFLPDVLDLVRNVDDDRTRVTAITALASRLTHPLAIEAARIAERVDDPALRADALGALVTNLPQAEGRTAFAGAIEAARAAPEPFEALVKMAGCLPIDFAARLPTVAADIPDGERAWLRPELTGVLIGRHADDDPEAAFKRLMKLAESGHVCSSAFGQVSLALARSGQIAEAVQAARMVNHFDRHEVLEELATMLPPGARRAVLDMVVERGAYNNADVLAALARDADIGLGRALLEAVDAMDSRLDRARVLARLVPELPSSLRGEVLPGLLDTVEKADKAGLEALVPVLDRAQVRTVIARLSRARANGQFLPFEGETIGVFATRLGQLGDYAEALEAVNAIPSAHEHAKALELVAEQLPSQMLTEVRRRLRAPSDPRDSFAALTAIAPHLSKGRVERILRSTIEVEDPQDRVHALLDLAPAIALQTVRDRALMAAIGTLDELLTAEREFLIDAFERVMRQLPEAHHDSAEGAAARIVDPATRLAALVTIANRRDDAAAPASWRGVLRTAQALESDEDVASALVWLTPKMPAHLQEELIDAAQHLEEAPRAAIFERVDPGIPDALRARLLTEARSMSKEHRFSVLRHLLDLVEPPLRNDVIADVFADLEAEEDAVTNGWLFAAVVEFAKDDTSAAAASRAQSALAWGRERGTRGEQANTLAMLAHSIPEPLASEAGHQALNVTEALTDADFADSFEALAAFLPPHLLVHLVRLADARITRDSLDADTVETVAFDLSDSLGLLALRTARATDATSAISAVRLIPDVFRDDVLEQLVSLLPAERLSELARCTEAIEVRGAIAVRLGNAERWPEALAVVQAIVERYGHGHSSDDDPGAPIVQLAASAPPQPLTGLLSLALELPDSVAGPALSASVARLPASERREVIERALASNEPKLLAAIAENAAAELPASAVVDAWTRALRRVDQSGRRSALKVVAALGPLVVAVFGPTTAEAIQDAIESVDRWWSPNRKAASRRAHGGGQDSILGSMSPRTRFGSLTGI